VISNADSNTPEVTSSKDSDDQDPVSSTNRNFIPPEMGSDQVSSTVHHATSPTHSTLVEETNGRSSPESDDKSIKLASKSLLTSRKPTFVILGAIPDFYQMRIAKRKELSMQQADLVLPKFARPKSMEKELAYLNEVATPLSSPKQPGKSFQDKLKALDEKFKEIPQFAVGMSQVKGRHHSTGDCLDKTGPSTSSQFLSSTLDDFAKRLKNATSEEDKSMSLCPSGSLAASSTPQSNIAK